MRSHMEQANAGQSDPGQELSLDKSEEEEGNILVIYERYKEFEEYTYYDRQCGGSDRLLFGSDLEVRILHIKKLSFLYRKFILFLKLFISFFVVVKTPIVLLYSQFFVIFKKMKFFQKISIDRIRQQGSDPQH